MYEENKILYPSSIIKIIWSINEVQFRLISIEYIYLNIFYYIIIYNYTNILSLRKKLKGENNHKYCMLISVIGYEF